MPHVGDIVKHLRGITPKMFNEYLVNEVRRRTGKYRIAVLYCDMLGSYPSIPGLECWPILAQYYNGPHPIIAHPPCEAWGRFAWKARQDRKWLGVQAMRQVHLWGGVVEHPWLSKLFIEHGRPGHTIQTVDQCHFGCVVRKRTDLYWTV